MNYDDVSGEWREGASDNYDYVEVTLDEGEVLVTE